MREIWYFASNRAIRIRRQEMVRVTSHFVEWENSTGNKTCENKVNTDGQWYDSLESAAEHVRACLELRVARAEGQRQNAHQDLENFRRILAQKGFEGFVV